jgi:CheY-like chemotaxis protein
MPELVPCLKFPTTLIIVDDNPEFLNNIELILGGEYPYKSFSSAKEALAFIKKQDIALQELIDKYLSVNVEDVELSSPTAKLNIPNIHHVLYNSDRFSLSSVVVTDFAMPDMNGIELCEHLKNSLIKTIMLTGEAGYDLAVSGFNEGLLDQFVLKSESDFFDKIKQFVVNLETKLFEEISKSLLKIISGKLERSIFSDPAFIKLFESLVKKHEIIEYYLLDSSGSYLMLNGVGQVFWLIVKNEKDMNILYEVAEEETKDKVLINAIKNKEKLAFLLNPDKQFLSPKSWRLEDAHPIKGRETYYYSFVEGTNEYYKLETKNLISHFTYMNK